MEPKLHIVIPKPQDSPLQLAQVRVPRCVVFPLLSMAGAIQFDGESGWKRTQSRGSTDPPGVGGGT